MADDDYDDDASSSVFDFGTLCAALQRNDPNFTTAKVFYDDDHGIYAYCPPGYGPRLGRALRDNAYVENIELQLGFMIQYEMPGRLRRPILDSGDEVHHFLRHSTSLRTVKLRTSCGGNWGRFISEGETLSFRKAILAVAENLHGPIALFLDRVERLESSFHPDVAPDLLVEALHVTTSMEELVVWLGDGGDPGYGTEGGFEEDYGGNPREKAAARKQVAEAFGSNSTLKRLTILDGSDERSVRALVPALRRNGSLLSVACDAFTPIEAARVQTYCSRNQRVLDLLAAFVHDRTMDVTNNDEDSENARARRLLIMPSFFAVVQHSPSMAYSRVVRGLQALTGGAGPLVSDGKRSR